MRISLGFELDATACEADVITALVVLANMGVKAVRPAASPALHPPAKGRRRAMQLFTADTGEADVQAFLRLAVAAAEMAGVLVVRAVASPLSDRAEPPRSLRLVQD